MDSNNNNDKEDIIKLYNKVWNNSYLRYSILYHLLIKNFAEIDDIETLRYNKDSSIHELIIDGNNIKLENGDIPQSVIKLNLVFKLDQDLQLDFLANNNNIKTLKFKYFNSTILPNSLPPIKSLYLGILYNQVFVVNGLPASLQSLSLGSSYNKEIPPNTLPCSLKSLSLGLKYNLQTQVDVFPQGLKYLNFGYSYNKEILPHSLPSSIETIIFGDIYNQAILPCALPSSLTYLKFGICFSKPLKYLPSSLKTLILPPKFDQELDLSSNNSLTYLEIGFGYGKEFKKGDLPNTITSLKHHGNVLTPSNYNPGYIPDSVELLSFSMLFNSQITQNAIQTTNIKRIVFSHEFNQPLLINSFPPSLESVEFGDLFDHPVTKEHFPNLKKLKFGKLFNQLIAPNSLPENLVELTFGFHFKRFIKAGSVGSKVECLTFGENFSQKLTSELIPESVTQLYVFSMTKIDVGLNSRDNLEIFRYNKL